MEDKLFPEYDIIKTLGEGAFANVYKVRHSEVGYIRAIRVLGETIVNRNDPKYIKFLEECKILLRLGNGSHKNIVGITQPKLSNGKALVEMDYIEGEDVDEFINKDCKGFVPVREVLKLLSDIASALAYCHYDIFRFSIYKDEDQCVKDDMDGNIVLDAECERNLVAKYKIIHNDIHSKNIRRKYDGTYVLLDFGLAIKNDTVVKSSTRKGGAAEYKSPEKWSDNKADYDSAIEESDIYSFGILMYEALAGSVPFPLNKENNYTAAEYELMNHHRHSRPEAIEPKRKAVFEKVTGKAWKKDYPDWLEDVIMKCLEKNPGHRFKNGKKLFEQIQHHLEHEKTEAGNKEARQLGIIAGLQKENKELKVHSESLKAERAVLLAELSIKEEKLAKVAKEFSDKIKEQTRKVFDLEKLIKEQEARTRVLENENQRLKSVRSNSNSRKTIFLWILTALAMGLTGYFVRGKTKPAYIAVPVSADSAHIDAHDSIRIYGSTGYRVYFYNTPSFASRKTAYFSTYEAVPVLKDSNNFVYIEFRDKRGRVSKGWINRDEAKGENAKQQLLNSILGEAVKASLYDNFVKAVHLYERVLAINSGIDSARIREEIRWLWKRGDSIAEDLEFKVTQLKIDENLEECDPRLMQLYNRILEAADRPRILAIKTTCEAAQSR